MLAVAGIATLLLSGSVAVGVAAAPPPGPVASIAPGFGDVVGVGAPVTVTFAKPIADRAAAERSIHFSSPNTPPGTFAWLDDKAVQWTPKGFWPAHSTISMNAGGFKTSFETGSAVVGVADIDAHTFTVSIDGQVVREMPASMGKPRHPTPIGSFTALEKQSPVIMDSRTIGIPLSDPEGYRLTGRRRSRHLGRGLRAQRSVVGGFARQFERQPRVHQPQPRQRRLVLQHREHRGPHHRAGVRA